MKVSPHGSLETRHIPIHGSLFTGKPKRTSYSSRLKVCTGIIYSVVSGSPAPPRYAVGLRNALVLAALLPATARAESFAFADLWGAGTGVEGAVDLLGDGHVAIRRRRTAPRHDDQMDGSQHGMSSPRGGRWAGVAGHRRDTSGRACPGGGVSVMAIRGSEERS